MRRCSWVTQKYAEDNTKQHHYATQLQYIDILSNFAELTQQNTIVYNSLLNVKL